MIYRETKQTDGGPAVFSAVAAIAAILTQMIVMLAALFAQQPPHPPSFLAPLIGVGVAFGVAAAILTLAKARGFFGLTIVFVVFSLISFGPHKLLPGEHPLFFAQTPAVYPIILSGTFFVAMLLVAALKLRGSIRAD